MNLLGYLLFSAGLGILEQASVDELIVAMVTSLPVSALIVGLQRSVRLKVVSPFLGAIAVAVIVFTALRLGWVDGAPTLLLVPALVYFLPGDMLAVASIEIAMRQLSAGSARLVFGLWRLVMLFLGVMVGYYLAGTPTWTIGEPRPLAPAWTYVGVLFFGAGMALVFDSRLRDSLWMLLLLFLTWGCDHLLYPHLGPYVAAFIASAVLAGSSTLLSEWRTVSAQVVSLSAFFVLVPGDIGFIGLVRLGSQDFAGASEVFKMLILLAAISLGFVCSGVLLAPYARKRLYFGPV